MADGNKIERRKKKIARSKSGQAQAPVAKERKKKIRRKKKHKATVAIPELQREEFVTPKQQTSVADPAKEFAQTAVIDFLKDEPIQDDKSAKAGEAGTTLALPKNQLEKYKKAKRMRRQPTPAPSTGKWVVAIIVAISILLFIIFKAI